MIENNDFKNRESFEDALVRDINSHEKSKVEWVNVVAKGIDNTGLTDMTVAIQNILDTVSPGSTVYFPKGTYLISKGLIIKQNINIRGDTVAIDNETEEGYPAATMIKLKGGISNVTMLTTDSSKYVRCSISCLLLKSSSFNVTKNNIPDGTTGLRWNKKENYTNVNGIIIGNNSWYSKLENIYVQGFSGIGIKTGTYTYCNYLSALDCHIGIDFGTDTQAMLCRSQKCEYGFFINGGAVKAINCRCDEIVYDGIVNNADLTEADFLIDQAGHSALRIKKGENLSFKIHANRCCNRFSGADWKSINPNLKQAYSIIDVEGNCSRVYLQLVGFDVMAVDDSSTSNTIRPQILSLSENVAVEQLNLQCDLFSRNETYYNNFDYNELSKYIYIPTTSSVRRLKITTLDDLYYAYVITGSSSNNKYIKNNWLINQTEYSPNNHYLESIKPGLFKLYNGEVYVSIAAGEENSQGLWKKITSTSIVI